MIMNSIFNSFMDIKKDNINLHLLKKKIMLFLCWCLSSISLLRIEILFYQF